MDTSTVESSSDALTGAEFSAKVIVYADLTHTPLSHSSKRITSELAINPKEDVDPSLGNIN